MQIQGLGDLIPREALTLPNILERSSGERESGREGRKEREREREREREVDPGIVALWVGERYTVFGTRVK
jgi:hypothetical protein